MKKSTIYQSPAVDILFVGEDVISTSAIELPFIPMSMRHGDEESEI